MNASNPRADAIRRAKERKASPQPVRRLPTVAPVQPRREPSIPVPTPRTQEPSNAPTAPPEPPLDTPERLETAAYAGIHPVTGWEVVEDEETEEASPVMMLSSEGQHVAAIDLNPENIDQLMEALRLVALTYEVANEEGLATQWRLTDPEDPNVDRALILERHGQTLAILPLAKNDLRPLADAIDYVAPATNHKRKGFLHWAKRHPKTSWFLGIVAGLIFAGTVYASIITNLV